MQKRLYELLIQMSLINEQQLAEALEIQKQEGGRLGEILIKMGLVSEQDILEALSQQFGIPLIDLEHVEVDDTLTKLIPLNIIRRFNVFPIMKKNNTLTIAISDPARAFSLKEVQLLTGYDIKAVLSSENSVNKAIEKHYEHQQTVELRKLVGNFGVSEVASLKILEEEEKHDIAKLESDAKQAPVVQIVNHIFTEAVNKNASDIHLEPYMGGLRIRFRIDGVLYELIRLPLKYKDAVLSRVKVLSRMDFAEKRLPQDGRIKIQMKLGNRVKNLDIRVSTTPTLFGEKIVMRILDKENLMIDMNRLGFERGILKNIEEAIFRPWGMVLVTGPTGSGKTNTLYSIISRINKSEVNIMTVEDPVEFDLPGINQIQVHEGIGLTFSSVLRSFLRQDPNVILVGEIRDNETAEIAMKASLTGHLVFSTLHTNDAPSAITRLVDMGVNPYLVSSSVILICAQRLVRRICQQCREEVNISPRALINIGFKQEEVQSIKVYAGKGCDKCNNRGYKGRVGLFEVMMISNTLRELIVSGATSSTIRQKAVEEGMVTLRQSGLTKIKDGITTIEEVVRETF